MNEPKKPNVLASSTAPVPLDSRRAAAARGASGVLSTRDPSPPSEGGFSAMLQHAGLWDLVQLRCESRVRCVVCVTSGIKVGFLYFSEGQIVHAATGGVQGERAVLEILRWTSGTWEACDRPWPTMPTITTTWQGLFLRAAQQQDEAKRQSAPPESAPAPTSRPVSSSSAPALRGGAALSDSGSAPALRGGAALSDSGSAPALRGGASAPKRESQPQAAPVRLASAPVMSEAPRVVASETSPRREESGLSYRLEDFAHAARMDGRGVIVSGQGAAEEHAELAAYCCRLGDLLGELLGMGKLRAIDAGLKGGERCFVVRDAAGDTVVLRARAGADLGAVRSQLNL